MSPGGLIIPDKLLTAGITTSAAPIDTAETNFLRLNLIFSLIFFI
jgi:hypothetical protein